MLTEETYIAVTGEAPPGDFGACLAQAADMLHAVTLYAYVGRDVDAMPKCIADRWYRALALQTQAVSLNGGIMGAHDEPMHKVSLGKYSYTTSGGGQSSGGLSPAVSSLLPMLISYGRGLAE